MTREGVVRAWAIELVFTGVMDYPPNVEGMRWFCREVWPLITQRLQVNLKMLVADQQQPCLSWQMNGIQVVGEVPDVRPYLDAADDIAISPLHLARGIQNKVLEAMASGLPAVVTPQSAEGIMAKTRPSFADCG